jgi:hypothetical protein
MLNIIKTVNFRNNTGKHVWIQSLYFAVIGHKEHDFQILLQLSLKYACHYS